MQPIITFTLYALTALVPLTFTTLNSELFEFPKFILLLSGTLILTVSWAIHLCQTHDYKMKLNFISYSVLAILFTQILATIFSINPYTSFWGYYSRFHGGLLTTICYTIIYFSALKWLNKKSTQKLIKISVGTAFFISLYAIFEHFGIDKNLWIQDVQNRVFSTLGQPNWLAAYLIPNIFLTMYISQNTRARHASPLHSFVFIILFIALLFTKSRSGFLAFISSYLIYWLLLVRSTLSLPKGQFNFAKIKQQLFLISSFLFLVSFIIGTPISPSLSSYFTRMIPVNSTPQGTVLDSGGTESGDIRKIVWEGALRLIVKHPLIGTGPETFAYTYYWERPLAHNLTSEWDFLYNKAHNEYLNIAAGAGLIGLIAYLAFHLAILVTSFTRIPKSKGVGDFELDRLRTIYPVLGATIVAFTITNFFGFSVIPVYLMIIFISILPTAIQNNSLSTIYHLPSTIYLLIPIVLLYPTRLFLADYYYARGKAINSLDLLNKAIAIRPGLDLYHSQLGETYATLGQIDLAVKEAETTRALNPYHLNYFKSRAKIYLTLATLKPEYNERGALELEAARKLAPTDPKLAYNLGLVYTRLNRPTESEHQFRDAISLKPNYPDPYYALTLLFEQTKQVDKIPPLLQSAATHLATYSSQLKEKIEKYIPTP